MMAPDAHNTTPNMAAIHQNSTFSPKLKRPDGVSRPLFENRPPKLNSHLRSPTLRQIVAHEQNDHDRHAQKNTGATKLCRFFAKIAIHEKIV